MARNKSKGTLLRVFSGREARLNRVIFLILCTKQLLTSYEMYLEIRKVKGFRHIKRQNVDRRIKALHEQYWLKIDRVKPAKAHFLSPVYKLTIRAIAAMELNKKNLNEFLQTAPDEQLQKLSEVLSAYP
ncbi:MAG: hypothetical protein NWF05_00890 [Candidatus Bathyarchaeota archaeon]|nr:hypothetical protein [Candidatus Bathyarchaeota archaeon]